jgi:hypothetical protein
MFHTKGRLNQPPFQPSGGKYSNPEVDRLIERAVVGVRWRWRHCENDRGEQRKVIK